MRAILPGRPQSTRQALCTAEWDGLRLVAYISGDTAIIFDGKRKLLQTIYVDDVDSLLAISIEEFTGRLALCDKHNAYVYEPLGRDEGDLRWTQIHKLQTKAKSSISCLSWGSPDELLVSGSSMVIWHIPDSDNPEPIWTQQVASPVKIAYFSPGAGLIASCGQYDRIVKIWRRLSYETDGTRFDVSYLRHPSAVTNLHWRKPWHSEQSLDSLLYTFCADNQIRTWTYSDPHSPSVMQRNVIFDMNQSIQPRRLSVGSMSKRRYAFIFDSRDFSSATEKAIQISRGGTDHALEHLIEIANRSPEVCVILDGVGHMSAWGLENAGYKNKLASEKFNVALVDGVDVRLPADAKNSEEYIHFTSFAGGSHPSSLSLLVHSYSGHIDWYESSISEFFDTSIKQGRTKVISSWSGHDATIERMVRTSTGKEMFSWTDEGQALVWTQSDSGALFCSSELELEDDVVDVCLLDNSKYMLVLFENQLSLWDLRAQTARKLDTVELSHNFESTPCLILKIQAGKQMKQKTTIAVLFENGQTEIFHIYLPHRPSTPQSNGFHKPISSAGVGSSISEDGMRRYVRCTEVTNAEHDTHAWFVSVVSISADGELKAHNASLDTGGNLVWKEAASISTKVDKPSVVEALTTGKVAVVDANGRLLSIWDLSLGCCEFQVLLEKNDRIERVCWSTTVYKHCTLAVSFAHHVKILGQTQLETSDYNHSWKVYQDIRLRDYTTHPTGDLCWLRGSDLAIGAGNQILIFEVAAEFSYQEIKHSHSGRILHKVDQLVDIANSEHPLFHPNLLDRLVFSMQYSLVEQIIHRLYQALKYYTKGDDFASDLQMPLEHLSSIHPTSLQQKDLVVNSSQEDQDLQSLEEVLPQLQQDLAKVGSHLLCNEDKKELAELLPTFLELQRHQRSLDTNALIYLYAFLRTPQDKDLSWHAYVAATLSTSQEALLDILLRHYDSKITYTIARRLGLFLWISETEALRIQLENVARAEFNHDPDNRNPVDCSLYYIALNKKQVLISLWRMTTGMKERDNTMKLLRNDFDEPRWKATALKNAYALLSKRRFEYAAAFFLLGGNLPDAVNVCINQMEDFQLAIAITRVWDRDDEVRQKVLDDLIQKRLVRIAADNEQGRWMSLWGYCRLKKWALAIRTIALPPQEAFGIDCVEDITTIPRSCYLHAIDPALIDFYLQIKDVLIMKGDWTESVISPQQEWAFVVRCTKVLSRTGMSILALRLVKNWKFVPWQESKMKEVSDNAVRLESMSIKDESDKSAEDEGSEKKTSKPQPTQFYEPSADSLLDSFGF